MKEKQVLTARQFLQYLRGYKGYTVIIGKSLGLGFYVSIHNEHKNVMEMCTSKGWGLGGVFKNFDSYDKAFTTGVRRVERYLESNTKEDKGHKKAIAAA